MDATLACESAHSRIPNACGALILFLVLFFSIVGSTIPAASFAASHQAAMGLTNSQVASLAAKSKSCGYDATLALVTYPPKGKIPLPNKGKDVVASGCDVDNQMYNYGML